MGTPSRIVLVTAWREASTPADRALMFDAIRRAEPTVLVHGGGRGGDQIADEIARELGIVVRRYPVDPALDGPWPEAGPRRNERMLREEPVIHEALAFPGPSSRGTWHTVRLCEARGIKVRVLHLRPTRGVGVRLEFGDE